MFSSYSTIIQLCPLELSIISRSRLERRLVINHANHGPSATRAAELNHCQK
jgi:hypothetical protein